MSMTAADRRQRLETELATQDALVCKASNTSSMIRQRLASVADDLRLAAETAGAASGNLLHLADRFEQHSRAERAQ
jgi:hypothetical protein